MLYAKHRVEDDLADLFRGDCRLPLIPAEAQLARQHVTKTIRHAPRRYRFEARLSHISAAAQTDPFPGD
jgi:hypothetical protein